MVDPMNTLRELQRALDQRAVRLQACKLHPNLGVHLDHPVGRPRFTYACVRNGKVHSIALFVETDPIERTLCFNVGYAVQESERRKGLAADIVRQSIEELIAGLHGANIRAFYLEAVVAQDNEASNRLARKLLSTTPAAIVDAESQDPAFQYVRRVDGGAST